MEKRNGRVVPGPPPVSMHTTRGKDGKFIKGGDPIWISNCCGSKMRTEGKKTRWYICLKCNNPCNPKEK